MHQESSGASPRQPGRHVAAVSRLHQRRLLVVYGTGSTLNAARRAAKAAGFSPDALRNSAAETFVDGDVVRLGLSTPAIDPPICAACPSFMDCVTHCFYVSICNYLFFIAVILGMGLAKASSHIVILPNSGRDGTGHWGKARDRGRFLSAGTP